jgi:nitrogenase molybdenum-iron protein beta chain
MPLKVPIGLKATDDLIMAMVEKFDAVVPDGLTRERGQVVDTLIDTHFHYQGKTVAVFGDPDIVVPLVEFLITMGMIPKYVITGTPGRAFEEEVGAMIEAAGIEDYLVKAEGDLFDMHQWIKKESVDLLIGNSHGKYIARAEDIPLVRVGFPIMDRAVHQLIPITGYKGCLRLIEMISNALLDRRDRDAADEDYELVL